MTQAGKTRRNTAQKDAVRRALASAEGFVSAQDLHRRLDGEGSRVALATVYRQLNALADEGRPTSSQPETNSCSVLVGNPTGIITT